MLRNFLAKRERGEEFRDFMLCFILIEVSDGWMNTAAHILLALVVVVSIMGCFKFFVEYDYTSKKEN